MNNYKQEIKESWFNEFTGPQWFIDYMLEDVDDPNYEKWYHVKKTNLDDAIINRINSIYWMNDAKHVAQDRVHKRINELKTDKQCVDFIKTWIDSKFNLNQYLKK